MGERKYIGKVVPQKGEDYFTPEDIESLYEYFAPAGYSVISHEDLNNTFENGLYWVECPGSFVNGQSFEYALLRVTGFGSEHCVQELYPRGPSMKLTRSCVDGVWQSRWGLYEWGNDVDF